MQTIEQYKYLKFSSLANTVFWDFYSLSNRNTITSRFPIVKLENVLKQRKGFILINDCQRYKLCRVQIQGRGVVLRDNLLGKEIKTKKQQVCKSNDFLVAEIDAKVGGFGIIPMELENAIVSGHYFLFEIDNSILLPEFLGIVVKQTNFLKQVKSTGSTNYSAIRPYHVLEYQIPLPTIAEQNKIVDNYNRQIREAEQLEQQVYNLEGEIEKYLFEELGSKITINSAKSSLLQFIQFEDTNRWDTLFILGKIPTLHSKFKISKFSDVIKFFNKDNNNKSIRVESSKYPNEEFRYIGMEHIEKETGRLLDMPIVKGKEIKSQTIRIPKDFILYGKLRPYLNKYWINQTNFDNIICSSEFFVFDIDDQINKSFFKQVMSSKIIQDQIADKTSGARMPRINEDIFFDLNLPLPPREIQDAIAENIEFQKNKIESFKSKAIDIKLEAEQEFEQAIFK